MELVRHPVHRALTRPQMFAGVTYNFFIINAAVTTELFLITGSFLALLGALVMHWWAISPACASRACSTCGSPRSASARGSRTGSAGAATATPHDAEKDREMSKKWLGAAAWSKKEAHAGDRLPYLRLVDASTVLLRDGSLMIALQVPGLLFETEDSEALNAHAATREVMLRSNLDARFVLYHHVDPPPGERGARGELRRPAVGAYRPALARQARRRLAVRQRPVRDARAPSGARQGGPGRESARLWRRKGSDEVEADPRELRGLRAAAQALTASLGDYGAQLLGDYTGPAGRPTTSCSSC